MGEKATASHYATVRRHNGDWLLEVWLTARRPVATRVVPASELLAPESWDLALLGLGWERTSPTWRQAGGVVRCGCRGLEPGSSVWDQKGTT